jgi:stage II sporulation protein D
VLSFLAFCFVFGFAMKRVLLSLSLSSLSLLFLSATAVTAAPATDIRDVRVAITEGDRQIVLGSSVGALVTASEGQVLGSLDPLEPLLTRKGKGGGIQIGDIKVNGVRVTPQTKDGLVYIDKQWFRGAVEVKSSSDGLLAVNQLPMEEYLYGVATSEMPQSWPLEAIKAQAVAARSYAFFQMNHRQDKPYDLGDTPAWQVYEGVQGESQKSIQAVDTTRDEVLTYRGKLAEALYHASSGGQTDNGGRNYLRSVKDYDQDAPNYRWQVSITPEQLKPWTQGLGELLQVTPDKISAAGRANSLKIVGTKGTKTIDADPVRIGLNLLSGRFQIAAVRPPFMGAALVGADQTPASSFTFEGKGWGHGYGMSQWGAQNRAASGWKYRNILSHYYQGTKVTKLAKLKA